jgi:hypothetical protein
VPLPSALALKAGISAGLMFGIPSCWPQFWLKEGVNESFRPL